MNWGDARQAVQDGRDTVAKGDFVVRELADLAAGRLCLAKVDESTLCQLKRELQGFNMQTRRWNL